MSTLRDVLDESQRHERQRAVRALLRTPLLSAHGAGAEDFALVRRHARALIELFAEHAGWTLTVDRELARLRKTAPTLDDATRPARARPGDPPFTRRRYVLLCLALAALERSDRQTTLRRLAESVAAMIAEDDALGAAGVQFSLEGRDQRRDLVATMRWLLENHVIARLEGDEEAFVADRGDALYQVDRQVLAQVLVTREPPSAIDARSTGARLEAMSRELVLDSDESRRRALWQGLVRRLLDDPVVYFADLSEEERGYLTRSRAALVRRLEDMTGLVAELRSEGVALVDPTGDASDIALPEEGTDGHVALLLTELLAEHARSAPGTSLELEAIHAHVRALSEAHAKHWRKSATEEGAELELTERALDHLEGLRLVRRAGSGVVPLAAVGRFALAGVRVEADQEELFS